MFFLQMSGVPGSGKSTLAKALAKKTNAIVVDHDIVKSAMLNSVQSLETDAETVKLDNRLVGKISYDIEWALVDFYLAQGLSVILDSPCLYTVMVEKGTRLSQKHGAAYKYVECVLADLDQIDQRLRTREAMVSQNRQVNSPEAFTSAFGNSQRPSEHPCLLIDSSRPLETYLEEVITYLSQS
ncbi:AAA family ATPase [Tumebacillus flagellatus]|uniref:ATP-binding protein n=1 Tax=Tumebacillus flagellatus TaxID=1157490 RepID=A0A074LPC9_9BACL|nr:AAA family ATPase [Tumebacillus flagellatus]KEO81678.1 ATP-binding protein [Tumebacillus flagellatus]